MKRLLFIIILISGGIVACAQSHTIDRLKSRLHEAATDSARLSVLDSLSMYNMFFNNEPDSTFSYCWEYINKAFQTRDKKHLALAYARLSFYYTNIGQVKESLSAALKGLDIAEQYHAGECLSALYYDLAWAYGNLNEETEALNSAFKGVAALKQNKDPFFDQALHLYGMIGFTYTNIDKLDSALFYLKKMEALAKISTEYAANGIADWNWSEYYLSSGQYHKTDSVSADGIKLGEKTGLRLQNYFYIFSSESLLQQNKIASSIIQAQSAFKLSIPIGDVAGELSAADLLNQCYEKLNKTAIAYHYLKVKDSLDGVLRAHGNALDVQQFRFDQQLGQKERAATAEIQGQKGRTKVLLYVFVTSLAFLLAILMLQLRNSRHKKKANEVLKREKEKVEDTLIDLRSTQAQLVQREKMASLGELTAGIAHEIQNPLNFVNNFSDVNQEMLDELKEQLTKGDIEEAKAIAADIKENEGKINHHGKRAESIVKGMLEHSRPSAGSKELNDLNALADEYLRLAYHGLRAKDKSFTAEMITDFDKKLPKQNVISQDIGRAFLNLFNNAFYAVNEKSKTAGADYKPVVEVQTLTHNGHVEIIVKDNGTGIPDAIKDKIMQPFFTTKPTGKGTGLGLSLAYDIITKEHSGTIEAKSLDGEGSTFTIRL
jgi:two-component system NtrC family sensor kinase